MKQHNWIIVGLLTAGWILFFGQPNGFSTKLRMILVHLSTPFVKLGDYIPAVKSRNALAESNQKLRDENQSLRERVAALSEDGRENLRLRGLLGVQERVRSRPITARVIGRDASNWWKSIQIDRGSETGIRENLAVINADGLVGKTVQVTRSESRVLLLIDPNCKASALLQDCREPGVVAGAEKPFVRDSKLMMTFVDRAAKINASENVITSGLGGIFPKGIPIGTVTRVRLNPQSAMYQDVEIKPAVDFHKLEEVVVIIE